MKWTHLYLKDMTQLLMVYTTACILVLSDNIALTWTLYYLAKYTEHQEKCREEVKDVLRGRSHLD